MNAQISAAIFEDTLNRIRKAVDELRMAIHDGTAANPAAAAELADRMERYARMASLADHEHSLRVPCMMREG